MQFAFQNFIRQPTCWLRLGLGIMYLYSGQNMFFHPVNWYGFAPVWFLREVNIFVTTDTYLALQGLGEMGLGLILLAWFLPRRYIRIAAGIAAAELLGILTFNGVDTVTFRDIGLLGAALALTVFASKPRQV